MDKKKQKPGPKPGITEKKISVQLAISKEAKKLLFEISKKNKISASAWVQFMIEKEARKL